MKAERHAMPKQDPQARRGNFTEVALGYSLEQAMAEASRCLQCKHKPCVGGCPVGVPIPEFVHQVAQGDIQGALEVILQTNSLPAICGRVCPQEEQCEARCVLAKKGQAVGIGNLERFVADHGKRPQAFPQQIYQEKVAVVGTGPAGLAAAAQLALLGYPVTIFESLHLSGGVLRYGIPEFRLPKRIVDEEVEYIKSLGVELKTNTVVGTTLSLEDLAEKGYGAVFLGCGAGLPYFLGIPGENLNGVYSANEFLTRVNLMGAYRFPEFKTPVIVGERVAVIGAGNVAMDSARTALRLGAKEVSIIYRRSEEEMPARDEEIENAREEGVVFQTLSSPTLFLGEEGWVRAVRVEKMELGAPDASGRRSPVPTGTSQDLPADTVVVAVGQGPNPLLTRSTPGLKTNPKGNIVVENEDHSTTLPGVFAGGDVVTGAATVIAAMGAGKTAAFSIHRYLEALRNQAI